MPVTMQSELDVAKQFLAEEDSRYGLTKNMLKAAIGARLEVAKSKCAVNDAVSLAQVLNILTRET